MRGVNPSSRLLPQTPVFKSHPFLNVKLRQGMKQSSRMGFRGQDVAEPKPEGEIRIFCLGGSTTYGHGLSAEAAYPAQMGAILQEKYKGRDVEVVNAGVPTLNDILEQLVRPGRDPRSDLPAPILRSDVLNMEDLLPGMQLKGTVRNVVDFGAFVDIGVKQDGLLHRSQWPPVPDFGVGDIIEVEILKVEPDRGRIALGWIE